MENIDVGQALRARVAGYQMKPDVYSAGHVLSASDGVVRISGVPAAKYGELLAMGDDVFAIAMNLEENEVGAVLLNGEDKVYAGMEARGTGDVVEVPVGEALLGRVVSPLGLPLDGKGSIAATGHRPIETPAPSIIDREPVDRPLETGIIAVDAIIPIGRGQRELIIGDRQVGKTAIALSAILNQKDKGVICIYVAIGQKASTIAQVISQLEKGGAMQRSIVVAATASDTAPMQYIAPYAGCAMAEEFMYAGKDVLIVYDDLSKHAVAYRAMSLLLRRPPGREAYPGDVFYLHSRLLERAAQLSKAKGGGSISALPIVETMAGDISDYIPTNVISITDGQIFLETELFHSGVRPALNVGLSVSRVGGSAQAKATRKVAGSLRLELAQYRELAVFAQFGSDLDASTQATLHHGRLLTEMLKQDQFTMHQLDDMVAILFAASGRYISELQPNELWKFLKSYLKRLHEEYPETMRRIRESRELGEDTDKELTDVVTAELERYRLAKGEGA